MGMQNEMTGVSEAEKWLEAYTSLMRDASVGRLFRGIVHNLNGAVQAFSMQSELFGMMFQQADRLLSQVVHGDEKEKEKAAAELRDLLAKRAVLAEQMAEKVTLCEQIIRSANSLRSSPEVSDKKNFPLSDLLEEEITFLSADSFFKHRVSKRIKVDSKILIPVHDVERIRLSLQVVLQNALDAIRDQESPALDITSQREGEHILIEVQDNGCGVPDSFVSRLYNPFVSNKAEHAGLGLFIARKALEKIGGQIDLIPRERGASFILRLGVGSAVEC